ncbi:hypothetical protein ACFP63_12095 [Oerskovia jenensis]|uniref:Uncharacterized protein n=1 Tax=Oerskovia jenensis TaxID=162169 RepID=A0ABS2LJY9_9CELL|nr:hypothetical protein [Oerskovia jenensis]MBM7480710.1 hypothetical protein [Oerskovia jenensis]
MSQATTVLVELAGDPGDVERPLAPDAPLPPLPPRTGWRRWAWIVPTVPTVALIAYQQLAPSQGWPLPAAVLAVLTVLLLLVAVLALARYLDDRDAQRESRARDALLAAAERTTGSVLVDSAAGSGEAAAAAATSRAPDGATHLGGRLTFSVDRLPVRAPFTVLVPAGTAGPRSGDPVAVWYPRGTDGRPRVVLVRYQRAWADDLLAAMHPGRADGRAPTAGETTAEGPTSADGGPDGPDEPAAASNQDVLAALGRAGAEHPRLAAEVVAPTDAWRTLRVDLSLPGSVRSVLVFEDDEELVCLGPDGGSPVPLDTLDPAEVLELAERLLRAD